MVDGLQIMAVTVLSPQRYHDATQLNNCNFCVAYLFIGLYTSIMFVNGALYHTDYPYHMDDWLASVTCPAAGYLLITGTLTTSYLWMLNVLVMFLKLRFPLKADRHLSAKHLMYCAFGVWTFCLFLASVPFITGTGYNKVSLCLPFYATPDDTFSFLLLYTIISNMSLVVNIILLSALLYSFIQRRTKNANFLPDKIHEATLAAEKKIIHGLTMYVLLAVVDVVFLIMSCLGGWWGVFGREWFARLCVLEAVAGPLFGPLTRKQFHGDTRRLLHKWRFCRHPNADVTLAHSRELISRSTPTTPRKPAPANVVDS
jgi:hypothetical protein